MKALITGGSRSGKTRHALELAESLGPKRVYLATAEALDEEMADRIRRHRAERGPGWATIEEPLAIAPLLARDEVVLLDCLTLWLSNLMAHHDDPTPQFEALADALTRAPNPIVVVTNEIGLGIVPDNALSRRFRDLHGWLNQTIAARCDRVVLTVAGLPLVIR